MKGPPKPDKENPGDSIGPNWGGDGDAVWKIFLAVVFGTALTVGFLVVDHVGTTIPLNSIDIQELRQQISDLQNRVYDLENTEFSNWIPPSQREWYYRTKRLENE